MENNPFDHRETHDFMNVESFSQLPFIRPVGGSHKEKGIRLFGKEFGGETPATATVMGMDESYMSGGGESEEGKEICNDNNGGENTRKFECQYCCRNFPTSQALGGHQNAHKRERQHAKRAHLRSAMIHAGGFTEAAVLPTHQAAVLPTHQMYGLVNYRRLNGGVGVDSTTSPLCYYHHHHDNWNRNHSTGYTNSSRLYGNNSSSGGTYSQPPINGSPLALWRIPAITHNSPTNYFNRLQTDGGSMHPRPLLGNLEFKNPQIMSSSAVSKTRLGYEYEQSKPRIKDQVSLDLHL